MKGFLFSRPPRNVGRTHAVIEQIALEAATPEDAEAAVRDLHERGVAMLKDGKRYVPRPRERPTVVFDEEPVRDSFGVEAR